MTTFLMTSVSTRPVIPLRLDGDGPKYAQLYRALRDGILAGRMRPGTQLPASRALAHDLHVSRPVVITAYQQLLAEGYVATRHGSGTYVAPELPEGALRARRISAEPTAPRATKPVALSSYARRLTRAQLEVPVSRPAPRAPGLVDFRYGQPSPNDFPRATWSRIASRLARRFPATALRYGDPAGQRALREAVADHLRRYRAVECETDQVIIVSGSQQAIDLAARVVVDPGDLVVLEEPQYQGAREAFATMGARLVPVAVDDDGIDPERLASLAPRARLLYLTPSHQFPSGAVLPIARRLAVLEWAQRADAVVLEDDYDGEFHYEAHPLPSVQGLDRSGRVLYMGTFSKVLAPALRLAYLVLPPALVDVVRRAKWLSDRHSSAFEQLVLAEFIGRGEFERHLRRTRKRHSRRREALLAAVAKHLGGQVRIAGAQAGMHVVLWLADRDAAESEEIARRALTNGVRVYPITPYYMGSPPSAGLLIGYAGESEARIARGIAGLAEAMGR
jgi:GntR family transcriptional regulator / MocR family aminotransferase